MNQTSALSNNRSQKKENPVLVDDQQDAPNDNIGKHTALDKAIDFSDLIEEEDPATRDPTMTIDGVDMTSGAKLTFTFNEGLIVQILPNGDVF